MSAIKLPLSFPLRLNMSCQYGHMVQCGEHIPCSRQANSPSAHDPEYINNDYLYKMKSKHQRFYSDIRFQDTIKPTTGHKTLKISKKKKQSRAVSKHRCIRA